MAGVERSASARSAAPRRQPPDPPPPHPVGGGAGDVEAADPGQLADRLLAGRVDVEHRDLVGQREGGAELLGEGLGARVEVGLEDGDAGAAAPSSRRAESAARTSVGWWA